MFKYEYKYAILLDKFAVLRLRGLIYHMRVFFSTKARKSTIICAFKLRGF